MKYRISITLDEEILVSMKEQIRLNRSIFKSQSNFVESAIKEKIGGDKK